MIEPRCVRETRTVHNKVKCDDESSQAKVAATLLAFRTQFGFKVAILNYSVNKEFLFTNALSIHKIKGYIKRDNKMYNNIGLYGVQSTHGKEN